MQPLHYQMTPSGLKLRVVKWEWGKLTFPGCNSTRQSWTLTFCMAKNQKRGKKRGGGSTVAIKNILPTVRNRQFVYF